MDESERETIARSLEERAAFFARHAGYSYRPDQTPAEGLRETAEDLADAERWAEERGLVVRWEDDWDVGSHRDFYGDAYADGEPQSCEVAWIGADETDTEPLASLGCVDDADDAYRRVVAAELAVEARAASLRVALD